MTGEPERDPGGDRNPAGPPSNSDGLPWWANRHARLAVLLSCLAVLVFYLVATRAGLLGLGDAASSDAATGMWAEGCPARAAPPVADATSGEVLELREDLRRVVLGVVPRRLYRLGTVTSENAWSDNFPRPVSLRLCDVARGPGAYEMRWWMTRTDLVDDVFTFADAGRARRFFELAASPRCRPEGAGVPASSPPGAREVVWRNPDDVRQEDVFLLRGSRVFEVSDVRYEQQGVTQQSTEQRLGFAIAGGLACALPEAACVDPGAQRRLALASLAEP